MVSDQVSFFTEQREVRNVLLAIRIISFFPYNNAFLIAQVFFPNSRLSLDFCTKFENDPCGALRSKEPS